MKKIKTLLLSCLVISLNSCSDSDQASPVQLQSVSEFQIFDHGNSGNSSDLFIKISTATDETGIEEYRLYLAKGSASSELSDLINSENYLSFQTGSNVKEHLTASVMDTDGEALSAGISYDATLLSFAGNNSTASESISVQLTEAPYYDVETLTTIPDVEAILFNTNDRLIYAQTPASGSVKTVDITTGRTRTWSSNINGGQGGFGGSFNSNFTKFYMSFWSANQLGEYDIASGTWKVLASGINGPTGCAVGPDGNIYVASYWNKTIYKVTPAGVASVFANSELLHSVDGMIFVGQDLYVINFEVPRIVKVSPSGSVSAFSTLPSGANITGYLTYAGGVFYAGSGTGLYQINESGEASRVFGSKVAAREDGPAPIATTEGLGIGITAVPSGDTVFMAENGRIRMLIKRD